MSMAPDSAVVIGLSAVVVAIQGDEDQLAQAGLAQRRLQHRLGAQPGLRHIGQALNFNRDRGTRLGNRSAVFIEHGAHTAVG